MYLLNSILVSVVSVLFSLLISSLAGYGFAKFSFPLKDLLFFSIISLLMVPFQAIAIPLYLWVVRFRMADTYAGLALPLLVSAFGVFMMRDAIELIPNDYIDSARIDGCSEVRIYWSIILPNVKPALATLGIIKFLWTWNEFFWPLIVTNTESVKVVTLGLANFSNMYFVEYHLATAGAVISVIPVVIIFLFLQKWVVKGLVMSGLKG